MRTIILMLMLTGALFASGQRQIILGSFLVESNALFYSVAAQKTIDENPELKKLMDKYALKVEYKKIGDYNVVTIYPFENYPSLFETIAVVKRYYPAAYSINYPAYASSVKVQDKVLEEVVAQDAIVEEEPLVEEEPEVIESQAVAPVEDEIKYEPTPEKKPLPLVTPQAQESSPLSMDDLFLLIALLLVVIGFVIYKIKTKKKVIEV